MNKSLDAATRTTSQATSWLIISLKTPIKVPWLSLRPHPRPSRGSPPRWWPPLSGGTRPRWTGAWGRSCPPRSLRSPAPWMSGSGSSDRRKRCCLGSWRTPGRTPSRTHGIRGELRTIHAGGPSAVNQRSERVSVCLRFDIWQRGDEWSEGGDGGGGGRGHRHAAPSRRPFYKLVDFKQQAESIYFS